jgi:hypothetical protein
MDNIEPEVTSDEDKSTLAHSGLSSEHYVTADKDKIPFLQKLIYGLGALVNPNSG